MARVNALLFCLIFLLTSVTAALAAPVISVDRPVYDFGTLNQGKKLEHTFTITNKGDAPLTILRTHSSCGCTVAKVSTNTIDPGKTAELKTTFDSASFSGKVSKTITIETNDPAKPSYTLTIKGSVTEDLVVSPRQLNLGAVKAGTSKQYEISLENGGGKPLRIVAVSTPMQQVKATALKQLLKPGETTKITVIVSPKIDDRFLSGYLSISTDSSSKPEITVPIYGSVAK